MDTILSPALHRLKAVLALLLLFPTFADEYRLDWIDLPSSPSTVSANGNFVLSGAMIKPSTPSMNGADYTLEGAFVPIQSQAPDGGVATAIVFDSSAGSDNGYRQVTGSAWSAQKFCVGTQPIILDSVTFFVASGSAPSTNALQLQIFGAKPVTIEPSADTGIAMNLSGLTNPISLPAGFTQEPVEWTSATPTVLPADNCYWAVLHAESGSVETLASFSPLTGPNAVFGRAISTDAGQTWQVDNVSTWKITVRAHLNPTTPSLRITGIQEVEGGVTVSFESRVGKQYSFQSRDNFGNGGWSGFPFPQIPGTGGALRITLPNGESARRFFRLVEAP